MGKASGALRACRLTGAASRVMPLRDIYLTSIKAYSHTDYNTLQSIPEKVQQEAEKVAMFHVVHLRIFSHIATE